jgi:hypothetical protein
MKPLPEKLIFAVISKFYYNTRNGASKNASLRNLINVIYAQGRTTMCYAAGQQSKEKL